jgi:putative transposase
MFRISQFGSVLQGVPRGLFERIVQTHDGDRRSKCFSSWDHLVAMVYAQLSGMDSLRTVEASFNQHRSHHYHLGSDGVRRTTLADANTQRDPAIFAELAKVLMAQVGRQLRRESQELLYLLDSTSITLKGKGFDLWTAPNATNHTQGLKVHVLYGAHEQAPLQVDISAPNLNDVSHGVTLPLQAQARYVFDKGYCDYNWWHRIDQAGALFVTRFKRNAAVTVVQARPLDPNATGVIVRDEQVRFRHRHPGGGRLNLYDKPLRRVEVMRPGKTSLILVTNDLISPAHAIADYYKARWQIELFFKWIKQHLKLKRFLGRSERAVRIQILTALIAYLLVALYKATHALKQDLWTILCILRSSLFQRPATQRHVERRRKRQHDRLAQVQASLFA